MPTTNCYGCLWVRRDLVELSARLRSQELHAAASAGAEEQLLSPGSRPRQPLQQQQQHGELAGGAAAAAAAAEARRQTWIQQHQHRLSAGLSAGCAACSVLL